MTTNPPWRMWLRLATVLAFWLVAPLPAQTPAGGGVPARVRLGNKTLDVLLLGVQADKVQYCYEDDRRVVMTLKVADVQSAYFKFDYDHAALGKAAGTNDWNGAARILYEATRNMLPYLMLPENNAAPVALQSANYLLRAAGVKSHCGVTAEDRKLADPEYKTARYILEQVAAAPWFEDADLAQMRSISCLVMMNQLDDAQKQFDSVSMPEKSANSYGQYWLTRAQLEAAKGDSRAALGSVVQSVLYATKDLDSFPDAVLLSARCYDSLQDWYRARDTYYEVARLFKGTHWAEAARGRLRDILAKGVTREKEPTPIASVFFASEEDMNDKVEELLGLKTPAKAGAPDKGGKTDGKADTKQGKS